MTDYNLYQFANLKGRLIEDSLEGQSFSVILSSMILPFTVQQIMARGGKSDVFRIAVPAESLPGDIVQRIEYRPTLDTLHANKTSAGDTV